MDFLENLNLFRKGLSTYFQLNAAKANVVAAAKKNKFPEGAPIEVSRKNANTGWCHRYNE